MAEPNESLYAQNLNEKIPPDEMKILLYQLFAQYGRVLDIVMQRQYRMRGQAFVVYDSKADAAIALRVLQHFFFYGKTLKLTFALSKSDVVAKREGVHLPRDPAHSTSQKALFFLKLKEKQANTAPLNGFQSAHNVLFIDGLDPAIPESTVKELFGLYPGLCEVRYLQEKGVAFLEFASPQAASGALAGLKDYYVLPGCSLVISYARR